MKAPKLSRELPADQYAVGSDVSMEKIFAVKELLIGQQDKDTSG